MKIIRNLILNISILLFTLGIKIDLKQENKSLESNRQLEVKSNTDSNALINYLLNEKLILQKITNSKIEFDETSLIESIKIARKNLNDTNIHNDYDNEIKKVNDIIKGIDNKNRIDNVKNMKKIADVINIFKDILIKIIPKELEYSSLLLLLDSKNDLYSIIRFKSTFSNVLFNEPPEPYSTDDIPCKSVSDCDLKKKLWMKCSVERITIRTVYELVNQILRKLGQIVYTACVCTHIPAGDNIQVKCVNTQSIPGLVCTIPNMVLKTIFKISYMLWESYDKISNQCVNPINGLN